MNHDDCIDSASCEAVGADASIPAIHNLAYRMQQENPKSLSNAPDWDKCRLRATLTIRHGVMLAHNIAPSGLAYDRLNKAGDPRIAGFRSDCRTANSWIGIPNGLEPTDEITRTGQKERLNQRVPTVDFVRWAMQYIDNANMTAEFKALASTVPTTKQADEDTAWHRAIQRLQEGIPATRTSDVTKRLQSMAKVVLAFAMTKYDLEIVDGALRVPGATAGFQNLTGDAGFRPMDSGTTNDVLTLAIALVGIDEVKTAQKKRIPKLS